LHGTRHAAAGPKRRVCQSGKSTKFQSSSRRFGGRFDAVQATPMMAFAGLPVAYSRRMRQRLFWLSCATSVLAACLLLVSTSPARAAEEDNSPDAPVVRWCGRGLEPVAGGGCYAAPDATTEPLPLIIYLHGLFEPGPLEEAERERQARLAQQAVAAGFAVLALRGAEGECALTPENATKICWPSNEKKANDAPRFVEGWEPAMQAAESRHAVSQRFVLGFSNGGYFAGLIALRDLYDADAFVIDGAGPVEPVKAIGPKRPMLLLSGRSDAAHHEMLRLDEELADELWPHEHRVREGGHDLTESDIATALPFFQRIVEQSAQASSRARS
jgi:predicted esterase